MPTDSELAKRLYDGGIILACEFDAWTRQQAGATFYSMRKDYPREVGNGFCNVSTIWRWVEKVNQCIADARTVTDTPDVPHPRNPFHFILSQGSDVYEADDPTPQGKGHRSHYPDPELLKAIGKLPR